MQAVAKRASEKQVQWVLRLVVQAKRTPTPEFIATLRGLSDAQIRVVTARAERQAKKRKWRRPAPEVVVYEAPEPADFEKRYPDNGIEF